MHELLKCVHLVTVVIALAGVVLVVFLLMVKMTDSIQWHGLIF